MPGEPLLNWVRSDFSDGRRYVGVLIETVRRARNRLRQRRAIRNSAIRSAPGRSGSTAFCVGG
jgi:hypothetical protein